MSKRTHEEETSVSLAAVERGRAELQDITRGYECHNILNMGKTAFFYCATPTETISAERMAGRKQQKKRLTMAVCCNADGSTKSTLLFVGAARKSRCFKRRSAEQLGLQYERTAKRWTTSQLFQHSLSHFNEQIRAECRRVLLLVDNISSHPLDSTLSNVELCMLLPNITAFLQPQDADIIQAFKKAIDKVRRRYIVNRFDEMLASNVHNKENIERDFDSLYVVDVLTAMAWMKQTWAAVTPTTVAHCRQHTGIVDDEIYELVTEVEKLAL